MNLTRGANQPGFVEISRKRGRIAGFGSPSIPVDTLWCGTNRPRKKYGRRQNGWSFPPAVRELLLQNTQGQTAVHFFGGRADFGVRMDLDLETNPDVVGDAYLPPFAEGSFDHVILDPPYHQMRQQEKLALLRAACWVARKYVWWFHTVWIAADRTLKLDHAWLIRVGDQCAIRTLQRFKVSGPKAKPFQLGEFQRGPALKYNRWARVIAGLPFGAIATNDLPAGKQIDQAANAPGPKANQVFTGDWG